MAHLKTWTAVAAAGAALSLAGVIGVGPALAGAAPLSDALRHGSGAVPPAATPIVPGTYQFFVNGSDTGAITFASGNTFTAAIDSDSGTWAQAGKLAALTFTAGSDAAGGCVFAGKANATGKAISSATAPGNWACPGFGSAGTFYIKRSAGAATPQASGDTFARSGAVADPDGPVVPGTYTWTLNGDYSGAITFASGNTYTSTLSGNDSGAWVQGGNSVALTITAGSDGAGGCLFVGKGNKAGTAIGTSKPGNWVCPGYGTSGKFVTS